MKSTLTIFLAFIALVANAQIIPNGNFENWTSNTWTNNPDDWETGNSQVLEPVTQDLEPYEGDFAMKVTSQPSVLGEYASAETTFDIEYIPASLDFYVKTEIAFGSVAVRITFYNVDIEVASHDWFTSENIVEWSPISIPMDQIEPIITHATIIVYGEVGDLVAGDAIISVDEMGFGTISGVDKIDKQSLSLYPNPAKDILNIKSPANPIDFITIYDITGKTIKQQSLNTISNQINVSEFPTGVYTILAAFETGERASQKLIITR